MTPRHRPAPPVAVAWFRRGPAVRVTAVLLSVAGCGILLLFGGHPSGTGSPAPSAVVPVAASPAPAPPTPAFAASLPWPAEGQAGVEVEGVGPLGAHGDGTPVPIASVTKVMTAYVILRDHPLRPGAEGPAIVADRRAADEARSTTESTAPVQAGHAYTERQLLTLLLLPSGNNIARLLARWDAGDERGFVRRMNEAAARLGMTRTTYTCPSGIEEATVSTAEDQLRLAREAMRDEVFREIVATRRTTVPGVTGPVVNSNSLLETPGVVGIKTGSTTPAGGNLLWAARTRPDGGGPLILGVVLHQKAGISAADGLHAAVEGSGRLLTAVRAGLAATAEGTP
ncbi:D-alanyl-D-alanine carboxypeptidase family protein (plasmid) [Streptomyces sp. BI20]|uniref:D-alanyl-D-alanine carboxypeptidase family protein n=1 Tax=Streptomyces sp. BI20 TaxID=3403460 RepID=UPI003C7130E5